MEAITFDRRRNNEHLGENGHGGKKMKIDHSESNGFTNGYTSGKRGSVAPTAYQRIGQDDFKNSVLGTCVGELP